MYQTPGSTRHLLWTFLLCLPLWQGCGSDTSLNESSRCDGVLQPSESYVDSPFDLDGDHFVDGSNPDCVKVYPSGSLDCDDQSAAVHPGVVEIECDLINNDCDPETVDAPDSDSDGVSVCQGDCNDTNSSIRPGANEVCDGIDQDCDGQIDEGLSPDLDGDGFVAVGSCGTEDEDCADDDDQRFPGATELCNGVDDNCDGQIDDGFPGEDLTCDGQDDNCNGQIDEGVTSPFYQDLDGDGYGSGPPLLTCDAPESHVPDAGDCDETNSSIYPGATELCNGVDDNCDGQIDDGVGRTGFPDRDGDGHGAEGDPIVTCGNETLVKSNDDCDDSCALVHPGQWEVPDGRDNNCDGAAECVDLSCDGSLDVLVMNAFYGDAYVYFADPGGGEDSPFNPDPLVLECLGTAVETGDVGLYHGTMADLDGDGELDVVLSSSAEGRLCLFLGPLRPQPGGHLRPDIEVPMPGSFGVDVGDVDGDLRPDIAVGSWGSEVRIFYGDSALSYSRRVTLSLDFGEVVVLRDLNDDQLPELLVAVAGGPGRDVAAATSSWVLWNMGGTYSKGDATTLPTVAATGVEGGDLDGDGYSDVIFSATYFNGNHPSLIYWGAGNNVFVADPTRLGANGPGASRVTLGSISASPGCIDVVLPCYKDGDSDAYSTLSTLYQGADISGACSRGRWSSTLGMISFPTVGAMDAELGDLTGDGIPDIIFANATNGPGYQLPLSIFPGLDGAGTFGENAITLPAYSATDLAIRSAWRVEGCR